jgi:molybdopterin converting factor small subunit
VRVRLFASLREIAGASWVEAEGPTVAAIVADLTARYGDEFGRISAAGTAVVGGEPAAADRTVGPGDEVALLPPVSGG